jgi:hypothetical protein
MSISTFIKSVFLTILIIFVLHCAPKIINTIFKIEIVQDKISIEDVWYHEPGNYSVGFYDSNGQYSTVSANK